MSFYGINTHMIKVCIIYKHETLTDPMLIWFRGVHPEQSESYTWDEEMALGKTAIDWDYTKLDRHTHHVRTIIFSDISKYEEYKTLLTSASYVAERSAFYANNGMTITETIEELNT